MSRTDLVDTEAQEYLERSWRAPGIDVDRERRTDHEGRASTAGWSCRP